MKDRLKEIDNDPIGIMYHALLAISCVEPELLGPLAAFAQIRKIADTALRRMNSEHTAKVQKALGID